MTAGQKSFILGNEIEINSSEINKIRIQSITRQSNKPLIVLKANAEEIQVHEMRLKQLEG